MKHGRENEPLRNTIREGSDSSFEFELMPKGPQPIGLVKIKNIKMKTEWGDKDGFRFVFRSRTSPSAFCFLDRVSAVRGRARLPKLVDCMSGGSLTAEDKESGDAIFNFMQRLKDRWYLGVIEHREWIPPVDPKTGEVSEPIIFVRIVGDPLPHPSQSEWGSVAEFFDGIVERRAGSDVQSLPSPTLPIPSIAKGSGFESMPDVEPTKTTRKPPEERYGYQFKISTEPGGRAKQLAFIKEKGGELHAETGLYLFKEPLGEELEKYFQGIITLSDEDSDDLDSIFGGDDLPAFD